MLRIISRETVGNGTVIDLNWQLTVLSIHAFNSISIIQVLLPTMSFSAHLKFLFGDEFYFFQVRKIQMQHDVVCTCARLPLPQKKIPGSLNFLFLKSEKKKLSEGIFLSHVGSQLF